MDNTAPATYSPTPGSEISSSLLSGILELYFSTTSHAIIGKAGTLHFNPSGCRIFSTASWFALESVSTSGNSLQNCSYTGTTLKFIIILKWMQQKYSQNDILNIPLMAESGQEEESCFLYMEGNHELSLVPLRTDPELAIISGST